MPCSRATASRLGTMRWSAHFNDTKTTRKACCWFLFPGNSSSARSDEVCQPRCLVERQINLGGCHEHEGWALSANMPFLAGPRELSGVKIREHRKRRNPPAPKTGSERADSREGGCSSARQPLRMVFVQGLDVCFRRVNPLSFRRRASAQPARFAVVVEGAANRHFGSRFRRSAAAIHIVPC